LSIEQRGADPIRRPKTAMDFGSTLRHARSRHGWLEGSRFRKEFSGKPGHQDA
jgi:hypothetical protein